MIKLNFIALPLALLASTALADSGSDALGNPNPADHLTAASAQRDTTEFEFAKEPSKQALADIANYREAVEVGLDAITDAQTEVATAQSILDAAIAEIPVDQAKVDAAQIELDAAKTELGALETMLEADQAKLAEAEAQLD